MLFDIYVHRPTVLWCGASRLKIHVSHFLVCEHLVSLRDGFLIDLKVLEVDLFHVCFESDLLLRLLAYASVGHVVAGLPSSSSQSFLLL